MRTHRVTTSELADILFKKGLLNAAQVQEVKVRGESQRARLRLNQGRVGLKSDSAASEPSAAEVIASFEFQCQGKPDLDVLDETTVVECLAESAGIPFKKIDPLKLDPALITGILSMPFARRTSALPIEKTNDRLVVAVSDPYDEQLFDELRRLTRLEISLVLSERTDIQRFITEVYGFKQSVARAAKEIAPSIDLGNLEQLVRLSSVDEIEANDQHVVNAVDYVLHYALDQRASDIHIEPKRDHSQVRMRIDGVLHDIYRIPKQVHPAIATRIKMLSRLDLAERRRPQDGRFKTDKEGDEVEMRVSTLPIAFGEKIVIRIFDPTVLIKDISDLGFDDESFEKYLEFVERPNGLVLVTGPTGSGKTTTLYSTLRHLSSPEVNITSIEDPIEMVIEDFNQIAVHPKIGLTFASSLKHILRQDPDVIMVGEIRDPETAEQALQAALTGHLVMSTLHTSNTATSVTRLLELGLNPFLISSTLVGVVAQRLVRTVCDKCREETILTSEEMSILGIDAPASETSGLKTWRGKGCVACRGTGLFGRDAIFEIMPINDNLKELINGKADASELLRCARADGMTTLREAAIRKLAEGLTSFEEVLKVTVDEDRRS